MTPEKLKIHRELQALRVAGILDFDRKGGRRRNRGKRKRTPRQMEIWLGERLDKQSATQ